jgi:hypothetical protein
MKKMSFYKNEFIEPVGSSFAARSGIPAGGGTQPVINGISPFDGLVLAA